jgi:hypothetical protein
MKGYYSILSSLDLFEQHGTKRRKAFSSWWIQLVIILCDRNTRCIYTTHMAMQSKLMQKYRTYIYIYDTSPSKKPCIPVYSKYFIFINSSIFRIKIEILISMIGQNITNQNHQQCSKYKEWHKVEKLLRIKYIKKLRIHSFKWVNSEDLRFIQ